MKRIQEKNWVYSLTQYYVNASFFIAYRRCEYIGTEKIPNDGAIIFAPNHTNCLQDALAVLALNHTPKVFVARADIFKNKKLRGILHWLKIMPIMRIRDGYSNLQKNDEIMRYAIDVLEEKVPFCIMPEGRHRPKHSLLPLVKGIFRIAMQANEKFGAEMPVYIVPFGIEYGNFFRFRSSLLVEIGNPINITSYLKENNALSVAEQMNGLKEMLTNALKESIFYIPDNENYNALLTLCQICSEARLSAAHKRKTLHNRLMGNKKIVETVCNSPKEKTKALLEQCEEVFTLSQANRISANSLKTEHLTRRIIGRILCLIIFLPYFLTALIIDAPIIILSEIIVSKIKDKAFCNSVRFVINLLLAPIMYLIVAIFSFVHLAWWQAVIVLLLSIPAHAVVHDYARDARLTISDIKLLCNKKIKSLIFIIRKNSLP